MNLIIVDIQPFYSKYFGRNLLFNTAQAIKTAHNITYYYNGEDVGIEDKEWEIREMFYDYLKEDEWNKVNFVEKSYAFLRNWMDIGKEDDILPTLDIMSQRDINDSREIEEFEDDDPIYFPDFDIPEYEFTHICGGGENECLKEMEILLEHKKINTKRLNGAIY